ncbi:MAG: DeoD-type purine-nucleoside phosphorylase [Propionibacteriaceae bacterium]|nr:DeoD-type purine-nucleoside phosphorylase [Propionibacteriaceae bacterium]
MATPHLACEPGDIAPIVLMPGDPRRAERIAKNRFEGARLVSDVRGIGVWTGTLDGVPATAMASGMGVPSLSIYATELYRVFGVKRICRVGTCGAFSPRVRVRDVVIASAAHTDSAVATVAIPGVSLSLVPSFTMLSAAVRRAQRDGKQVHVGAVFTSDFFYHPRTDIIPALTQLGALAVEMEAAGLYAAAASNDGEALAVLTASDHLLDSSSDLTSQERETLFDDALELAVAAVLAD